MRFGAAAHEREPETPTLPRARMGSTGTTEGLKEAFEIVLRNRVSFVVDRQQRARRQRAYRNRDRAIGRTVLLCIGGEVPERPRELVRAPYTVDRVVADDPEAVAVLRGELVRRFACELHEVAGAEHERQPLAPVDPVRIQQVADHAIGPPEIALDSADEI